MNWIAKIRKNIFSFSQARIIQKDDYQHRIWHRQLVRPIVQMVSIQPIIRWVIAALPLLDDTSQKHMNHEAFHYWIRTHIRRRHCSQQNVSTLPIRVIINIHIIVHYTNTIVLIAGNDHFLETLSWILINSVWFYDFWKVKLTIANNSTFVHQQFLTWASSRCSTANIWFRRNRVFSTKFDKSIAFLDLLWRNSKNMLLICAFQPIRWLLDFIMCRSSKSTTIFFWFL